MSLLLQHMRQPKIYVRELIYLIYLSRKGGQFKRDFQKNDLLEEMKKEE